MALSNPPVGGTIGPGPYNPRTAQGMCADENFTDDQGNLLPSSFRFLNNLFNAVLKSGGAPTMLVSALPDPSRNSGSRAFVSDATVNVFGSVVAGGGTVPVPVYCDGTAWRIG